MSIAPEELQRINALDGPDLIVALRDVYRRTVAERDRAIIAAAAQHIAKGAAPANVPTTPIPESVPTEPRTFAPGERVLIGIREGIVIEYEGGLWNVCVSKLGEFGVEHRIVAARSDEITRIK